MKTRFVINQDIFNIPESAGLGTEKEIYEKFYKNDGFLYDEEAGDYCMDFNREIQLNVGDKIFLYGYRIVTGKCYEIVEEMIVYHVKEE
jgi:hypothetical protein